MGFSYGITKYIYIYIYIYIVKGICRKPISQHPGLGSSLNYSVERLKDCPGTDNRRVFSGHADPVLDTRTDIISHKGMSHSNLAMYQNMPPRDSPSNCLGIPYTSGIHSGRDSRDRDAFGPCWAHSFMWSLLGPFNCFGPVGRIQMGPLGPVKRLFSKRHQF